MVALCSTSLDIGRGGNNVYFKGKYNWLSVFVVAIVVEMMGLGCGWGINPISQSIFGLNPCPTEGSNEEKVVKYAIFGGGTPLKGKWGVPVPGTGPFTIPIGTHLAA